MQNQLQIFNNEEFGQMKGYLDNNGVAWLNVECVARGLGITQIKDGVAYVRIERINTYLQEFGFPQRVGKDDFIPENIVYRLAMKAKNETAEDFQAWLADVIVPSIRKTGSYSIGNSMSNIDYKSIVENPDFIIQIGQALKAEKEKVTALTQENTVLNQQVAELTPKASYYDLILNCKDLISVSKIAKDYGLSATTLNKILNELGVQFKQGGVWLLYQKYAKKGWTSTKTIPYKDNDAREHYTVHTYWTQKGRLGLYELLKQNGYLPNIEK